MKAKFLAVMVLSISVSLSTPSTVLAKPGDIIPVKWQKWFKSDETYPNNKIPRDQDGLSSNTITYQILSLRRAIIEQESSVNFLATNRLSGALGYGQVMPENVGPWSEEALGYRISLDQFLYSPSLQLKIIDHVLAQYWREALVVSGGNEQIAVRRVASHWYSGKPHRYTSTVPQFYRGRKYPSIATYTLSVLAKYQALQAGY